MQSANPRVTPIINLCHLNQTSSLADKYYILFRIILYCFFTQLSHREYGNIVQSATD